MLSTSTVGLITLTIVLTSVVPAQDPSDRITSVSAANFAVGSLAPGMIVSSFSVASVGGFNRFTDEPQAAEDLPLPTALAGSVLKVVDSQGRDGLAPLFYVGRFQINWFLPEWVTPGRANLTFRLANGLERRESIEVERTSPGLFTASADGQGVPSALFSIVDSEGVQGFQPVFSCVGTTCMPNSLNLIKSEGTPVLSLFGTGFRGFTTIAASLDGHALDVLGAQAQPEFVGLDQLNIVLPVAFDRNPDSRLAVTVDGKNSNTVRLAIGLPDGTPPDIQIASAGFGSEQGFLKFHGFVGFSDSDMDIMAGNAFEVTICEKNQQTNVPRRCYDRNPICGLRGTLTTQDVPGLGALSAIGKVTVDLTDDGRGSLEIDQLIEGPDLFVVSEKDRRTGSWLADFTMCITDDGGNQTCWVDDAVTYGVGGRCPFRGFVDLVKPKP